MTEKKCPLCDQLLPPELMGDKTIMRMYRADGEEILLSLLDIDELMNENEGYEDSAWDRVTGMVHDRNGLHDDSDYRSSVVVWYMAQDQWALAQQANAWLEALVDHGAGFGLEPIEPGPSCSGHPG